MANLELELCKATFTEETVTLVAQYVEKLKLDLKEMLDIHLNYQMVIQMKAWEHVCHRHLGADQSESNPDFQMRCGKLSIIITSFFLRMRKYETKEVFSFIVCTEEDWSCTVTPAITSDPTGNIVYLFRNIQLSVVVSIPGYRVKYTTQSSSLHTRLPSIQTSTTSMKEVLYTTRIKRRSHDLL